MTAHEILTEIRSLGGHLEARGDRLHVEAPEGAVTQELKAELARNKPAVIAYLSSVQRAEGDSRDCREASMRRLENAGVSIAIWDTGQMRLLVSAVETLRAIDDGGTVYSPKEMLMYVELSERERRMLHDVKRRFGGTVEWRP